VLNDRNSTLPGPIVVLRSKPKTTFEVVVFLIPIAVLARMVEPKVTIAIAI
jgi:hypothetical protein